MDHEPVKISILGTSFSIKVDEDPVYVKKIIQYVENKISELERSTSAKDPLRLAILSSILIADDLFKERFHSVKGLTGEEAVEAERLTGEIIAMIDRSLT